MFYLVASHSCALLISIRIHEDIVNAPHNILNSVSLARTAQRLALESKDGCITCEILGKAECEERGMGAYLGVARGSETEPQFIHLVYKPKGEVKKKVGVIGKGLLFVSLCSFDLDLPSLSLSHSPILHPMISTK